MTAVAGLPCIDLYARPRRERVRFERRSRLENLWVGGALSVMVAANILVMKQELAIAPILRNRLAAIAQMTNEKKAFERDRTSFAAQVEKSRGIEGSITTRQGWLRLMQAISSATTDQEVLEQCTIVGKSTRTVTLTGSSTDMMELQRLYSRVRALPCLRSVRIMETAADKTLGPNSLRFRIEAKCDAADIASGSAEK